MTRKMLLILFLTMLIAGCGQSGKLYLPQQSQHTLIRI